MADDQPGLSTAQGEQHVVVSPGYLAGPGHPDTANSAFEAFLAEHQGWSRYSCDGGDTSVAVSDCLTGRIRLDHEPGDRNSRWTVAGYESAVGERAWHADFDLETPHEIALATASTLSHALSYSGFAAKDEALWGRNNTCAALVTQIRESDWLDVSTPSEMRFRSPDATAGLIRWDAGAFHDAPWSRDYPAGVTLWARRTGDDHTRTAWQAHFSKDTPTRLITTALDHLTDPQPSLRRFAEVPTAHLGVVEVRSYKGSPRSAAATATGRTTLADIPIERWNAAAAVAAQAAATRSAGRTT
ncbi:DUF317 domain-containing protein [Kitasatospora sp. NPDC101235]|uniref:DUF317 domain-containing protein n=1 Tax=Kitasatospora sp. NPDC101235 TaxID=3364101 RepID=UPI0037F259E1